MSTDTVLYKRSYVFSFVIRLCHWLRAFAIFGLVITGFYIAWPFLVAPNSTNVLEQGWIRLAHEVLGFILIAVTLIRLYLFFFSHSNVERRSIQDIISPKSWVKQIKAYFWMGNAPHRGAYGPLQLMVYAGISIAAIFMCVTGLTLYANVYHLGIGGMMWEPAQWVAYAMGGLDEVRKWHHYITWAFIIFVLIHVYMVIWTGIRFRNGSADAIMSGYDYHAVNVKKADKGNHPVQHHAHHNSHSKNKGH
ncbi:Ni/Fe-hydrogenase, b-type cytochrome subunit [Photobacterium toruni]|uniref:Ni/Fe-hydrogenase, b-type cytochrome subunit n=1 Tax=Photobacterium toruni TaxID=1935446 RepID=UPI002110A45F|nr:Ni/Fe-hydrogenase, b-type cytochrome subunit [Photobacterium toruni]